jgi:hypothetical protein
LGVWCALVARSGVVARHRYLRRADSGLSAGVSCV